ncbi:hypothetical protein PR048_011461 [Dryococelus australis]|uniref:Uncharacterized protein n=1 Tax=Dryococelus australis TaxID=614101 RepID=A0ABQ9HM87_9NEOP|nr:hypothetical protein PR048_011461 [Dryococelus australis]
MLYGTIGWDLKTPRFRGGPTAFLVYKYMGISLLRGVQLIPGSSSAKIISLHAYTVHHSGSGMAWPDTAPSAARRETDQWSTVTSLLSRRLHNSQDFSKTRHPFELQFSALSFALCNTNTHLCNWDCCDLISSAYSIQLELKLDLMEGIDSPEMIQGDADVDDGGCGNSRAAACIYRERNANRHVQHYSMFTVTDRRLREEGTFTVSKIVPQCVNMALQQSLYTVKPSIPVPIPCMLQMYRSNAGCLRWVRTIHFEKKVLERFHQLSSTSTRQVTHVLHTGHMNVWRVTTQTFYSSCSVSCCLPTKRNLQNNVLTSRKSHAWEEENTYEPFTRNCQEQFGINKWCGIVDDSLIGAYMLSARLNADWCLVFLEQSCCKTFHLGFDKKCGCSMMVHRRTLVHMFETVGPVRSPNFTPLNVSLLGAMKCSLYKTLIASLEDLLARIHAAAKIIRTTSAVFDHV